MRLHDATIAVRAIDALRAIGVFDALADGARSAAALAERCHADVEILGLALDVVRLAGILERDGDRWTLREPNPLALILDANAVDTVLRGGHPTFDAADTAQSGTAYASTVEGIGAMIAPFQSPVIDVLTRPGQHVLELAAGASPWGRALCEADPTTTVAAVDLPPVLTETERVVAGAGLTARYSFVAADVFVVDDLGPADLVLVAGFARLFGEPRNHEMFQRVARWCAPGGRVAVIDAVATPAAREAGLSRYELGLRTRTSEGRCWSFDHFARWLRAAGFVDIDLMSTARPEVSLVTARKGATP